ncbi:hypothetical protein Dsin_012675 [Dipteronia sinensis]|uniref:Uncharacterized protein n=1 Tax=Dipteronia sinensis TaxID=43782 RepID=A0AAE0AJA0_9ROSI|nr:hypothetical protein Dsin_012675 [Dipteronia sinensis]
MEVVWEAGSFVVKLKKVDECVDFLWLERFLGINGSAVTKGVDCELFGKAVLEENSSTIKAVIEATSSNEKVVLEGSGSNGRVVGSCGVKSDRGTMDGSGNRVDKTGKHEVGEVFEKKRMGSVRGRRQLGASKCGGQAVMENGECLIRIEELSPSGVSGGLVGPCVGKVGVGKGGEKCIVKGSGLSSVGGDLGGPSIDLFVDLGDLDHFFRDTKVGAIDASPCSFDRKREKMIFFLSRIHRMKTRSGNRSCIFSGVDDELADCIATRKYGDKG